MSSNQSILSILHLPRQVLIHDFLPKLPLFTLQSLCSTSSQFTNLRDRIKGLCEDPNLWIAKLNLEYPKVWRSLDKANVIPMELYLFLYDSVVVPVIYHGDRIGVGYVNLSTRPHMFLVDPGRLLSPSGNLNFDLSKLLVSQMYPGEFVFFLDSYNNRIFPMNANERTVTKVLITDTLVEPFSEIRELASQLGHPPIYGYKIESSDLIVVRTPSDPGVHGTNCKILSIEDINELLETLSRYSGVHIEHDTRESACAAIIQHLKIIGHYFGTYERR